MVMVHEGAGEKASLKFDGTDRKLFILKRTAPWGLQDLIMSEWYWSVEYLTFIDKKNSS